MHHLIGGRVVMWFRSHVTALGLVALLACVASPLAAQIEDQLSAYTGRNAKGYLQPLADALGADFNTGIFHGASIPKMGVGVRLEFMVMGTIFGDDDRSFNAVTEGDFSPVQYAEAPTIVGSEKAAIIGGDGGTSYVFPGGFNIHSFALAVPQLRIGSVLGTEAIIRYFAIKVGDDDLGKISLFGIGVKHDISQHLMGKLPVDVSAGFFWQKFNLGENKKGDHLISSSAFSIGVQVSKRFAKFFEPYGGLTYDTFSMDVSYENDSEDNPVDVDVHFDTASTMHLTLGFVVDLPILNLFAEYGVAKQSGFAFGASFGYGI
jgi:hypothetical protein